MKEELYCNKCKDYTEHDNINDLKTCKVCEDVYEENRKRYVICGPKNNETVIKASEELLKKDPTVIIINEDKAFKHRLKGIPMKEKDDLYSELVKIDKDDVKLIKEVEKFKYNHLTKKEKEAEIVPIRTEPKIQRNALCPCGKTDSNGKRLKYKHCCLNA